MQSIYHLYKKPETRHICASQTFVICKNNHFLEYDLSYSISILSLSQRRIIHEAALKSICFASFPL